MDYPFLSLSTIILGLGYTCIFFGRGFAFIATLLVRGVAFFFDFFLFARSPTILAISCSLDEPFVSAKFFVLGSSDRVRERKLYRDGVGVGVRVGLRFSVWRFASSLGCFKTNLFRMNKYEYLRVQLPKLYY